MMDISTESANIAKQEGWWDGYNNQAPCAEDRFNPSYMRGYRSGIVDREAVRQSDRNRAELGFSKIR